MDIYIYIPYKFPMNPLRLALNPLKAGLAINLSDSLNVCWDMLWAWYWHPPRIRNEQGITWMQKGATPTN